MSAALFGVFALLLAGPIPALLSKAAWPIRAPRPALVLWQAIAAGAVLSAFSCGLAIASKLVVVGPDGRPTTSRTQEIDSLGVTTWLIAIGVFILTLVVGARLIYASVRLAIRTRQRRARHRTVVDLLSERAVRPKTTSIECGELRVLAVEEPLAYCLPGLRQRVVLSEGTLRRLDDDELLALMAHERAHLRARHDLVLEAFTAVHHAFPRLVRSQSALGAVGLLIELLADDHALHKSGPRPLARALVACAGSRAPQGALAAGGTSTVMRVERLSQNNRHAPLAVAVYLTSAAVLIIPTIAVALPWLTEVERLFLR